MDAIEPGTEGSAVAMLFTGGAIIGASAPVIAGLVYSNLEFEGLVIYAGVIACGLWEIWEGRQARVGGRSIYLGMTGDA